MAGTHECNGISASPNSSEEVESHRGTPATKLSAFSPEDNAQNLKPGGHGIVRSNVPPAFNLVYPNTNFSPNGEVCKTRSLVSQDPFISVSAFNTATQPSTGMSKLSAAASNFTPATSIGLFSSHGLPLPILSRHYGASGLGHLESLSSPLSPQINTFTKTCAVSGHPAPGLLPSSIPKTTFQHGLDSKTGKISSGKFSCDVGLSRSIMISGLPPSTPLDEIYDLFSKNKFYSLEHILVAELHSAGTIFLKFGDLREAEDARGAAETHSPPWNAQYITPKQLVSKLQAEGLEYCSLSMYEGQVLVTAEYEGSPEFLDVVIVAGNVKEVLGKFGALTAYEIFMIDGIASTYRVEFYNATAAKDALAVNGFKIGGCTLSILPYEPDVERTIQRPVKVPGPLIIGQESSLDSALGSMTLSNKHRDIYGPQTPRTPSFSPFPISDPTSRHFPNRIIASGQHTPSSIGSYTHGFPSGISDESSTWSPTYNPCSNFGLQSPIWPPFSPGAIGQERGALTLPPYCQGNQSQRHSGQAKLGGRQGQDFSSGHHNVVDVNRIRHGADIMLRNIPNKIDQAMLKTIVDETSFAKYDFMYLRIDFANNCNVGYAFINFEDPYSIIDFVETRAGRRWNRYNSDKVAEVSYATIQGRDCLIQKFRNSSVMLEHPTFRPKLFHTGTGPQAGAEETFPQPDNPSKMKRSIENAEHVGLFAPRAGQNFRDEQRRRRSQYDRGTRLAEVGDIFELGRQNHQNAVNGSHMLTTHGKLRDSYYPSLNGSPF